MKKSYLFIFFFPFYILFVFGQKNIISTYQNEFGSEITFKDDNTFEYKWKFDLASSWNVGTWRIEKQKFIILIVHEIMDTLKVNDSYKLVLSDDKISNEINNESHVIHLISGGGQSRKFPPKKLLIKNDKLYTYSKNNRIQRRKLKSIMNGNRYMKPWFEKLIYQNNL